MQLIGRRTYAVCIVIVALAACQRFFGLAVPQEVWIGLFSLAVMTLRSAVSAGGTLLALPLLAALLLGAGAAQAQTTFSGSLSVSTSWRQIKVNGQSELVETIPSMFSWTHTDGTNTLQMNAMVSTSGTLAAGATNALTLGAINNGFGDAISFKRVTVLGLAGASTNAAAITLGGAAAGAFAGWAGDATDKIKVMPGGFAFFAAPSTNGYTVGTATNLWIINTGASAASYNLYIGGTK